MTEQEKLFGDWMNAQTKQRDIVERLNIIRDHLRTGAVGQREVWEEWLAEAADGITRLEARVKVIEEAALAAYRYHMLGYKDAHAFNANTMLDHMNKLGEVL